MTNTLFQVAVMVLWSTNTMDAFLTPVGDDIVRSTITTQTHVYNLPGTAPVTNAVPVLTNSVHLRRAWVKVDGELPPVPDPSKTAQEFYRVPPKASISEIGTNETAGPVGTFRSTIGLQWDQATNSAPDLFKLYTTTDISTPLTDWKLVATVSGEIHNITISNIEPIQAYFYLVASNWWGESLPSNVAQTPPIPSDVRGLTIGP
jgi:hypothetical protein